MIFYFYNCYVDMESLYIWKYINFNIIMHTKK